MAHGSKAGSHRRENGPLDYGAKRGQDVDPGTGALLGHWGKNPTLEAYQEWETLEKKATRTLSGVALGLGWMLVEEQWRGIAHVPGSDLQMSLLNIFSTGVRSQLPTDVHTTEHQSWSMNFLLKSDSPILSTHPTRADS